MTRHESGSPLCTASADCAAGPAITLAQMESQGLFVPGRQLSQFGFKVTASR